MPDSAEGEVELPPCAKVKLSNATDRGRMGVYLKGHQEANVADMERLEG